MWFKRIVINIFPWRLELDCENYLSKETIRGITIYGWANENRKSYPRNKETIILLLSDFFDVTIRVMSKWEILLTKFIQPLCQKILEVFKIAKINIPNQYPEQKIWRISLNCTLGGALSELHRPIFFFLKNDSDI